MKLINFNACRNELNTVAEIPGLKWSRCSPPSFLSTSTSPLFTPPFYSAISNAASSNAISNANWRGVRLRDVLLHAGYKTRDAAFGVRF